MLLLAGLAFAGLGALAGAALGFERRRRTRFIAEAAGDAQEVTATGSDGQLDHVSYWASEMLQRVMVSRKASAPDGTGPDRSSCA